MTLEEIRAFLEEHKDDEEVKTFLAGLSPAKAITAEDVLAFIATEEGKLVIQPTLDQAVTKAVKTRDKAHEATMESEVKRRVAAEMLKVNPQKEPWQIEIEELKKANEEEKKARQTDQLKRQMVEKASTMGVDAFFIEDYLPESIEVGELFLKKIKERDAKMIERAINERIASGAFKPGGGPSEKPKGTMTFSEYKKLPQDQRIAMVESGEIAKVVPD